MFIASYIKMVLTKGQKKYIKKKVLRWKNRQRKRVPESTSVDERVKITG